LGWKGKNRYAEVRRAGRVVSIVNGFFETLTFGGRWTIIIYDFIIILRDLPVYQLIQHNEFFILKLGIFRYYWKMVPK